MIFCFCHLLERHETINKAFFFNCSFSETEISSNQQFSLPWVGLFLVGFYISLMTSIDDLLDDLQVTA